MLKILENSERHHAQNKDKSTSILLSLRNIIIDLKRVVKRAEDIGDKEIKYLTLIALESANEKFFLAEYEKLN